jgi:uncharacterized membrane protein YGL010W
MKYMKTLEQQMAFYAAYHRNRWNRLTHFVGVPAIIFSILIPLAWLRLPAAGVELTVAMLFVAIVLLYYFALDVPLALAMTAFIIPVLYCADRVARLPWQAGLAVFLAAFIGGWVIQLVGHAFEGRKPALADNLFQIFVAPIFLVAEAAFALGLRRGTQHEVERLSHLHD